MKADLTKDLVVKSLSPKDKPYYCMSASKMEKGFGILVYPSGSKTFIYKYKVDKVQRLLKLGEYPDMSLQVGREEYQKASHKVKDLRRGSKDGLDPVLEKKKETEKRIEAEAERRRALTVHELVERYIERHAKLNKKSWKKDEEILNRDVLPLWGKRKAGDVLKRDVVQLLEGIVDRGAPAMANNCFQIVRKMFNWAVEKDILPHTPCTGVKLPSRKQFRERTLKEAEIKTMWVNLSSCAMSDEIRRALKLILITAQRPGEVIGMHTSEIDGNWWTIPAERAKNGKTHRVFLTPLASETINQAIAQIKVGRKMPSEEEYSGYIFPCPIKKKNQSIAPQALIVAVSRGLASPVLDDKDKPVIGKDGKPVTENKLGVDHFTPHDLRRTAATFMAEMGTMDEVIDAILNHAKKGVIKVYNQYRYDKEKQLALESWERKLNNIIKGEASAKIVSIQRRTRVNSKA